jgi:hypothetical protein
MQITGKLVQVLPEVKGNGKNGTWIKKDIIITTDDRYPKNICISIWGEKINISNFKVGDVLTIDADIESKEYNSKWFTEIKAWRISKKERSEPENNSVAPISTKSDINPMQSNDDFDKLPF